MATRQSFRTEPHGSTRQDDPNVRLPREPSSMILLPDKHSRVVTMQPLKATEQLPEAQQILEENAKLKDHVSELKEEIKELETKLKNEKQRLKDMEGRIEPLETSLHGKQRRNKELSEENRRLKADLQKERSYSGFKTRGGMIVVKSLKGKLEEKEDIIGQLRKKLKSTSDAFDGTKSLLQEKEKELTEQKTLSIHMELMQQQLKRMEESTRLTFEHVQRVDRTTSSMQENLQKWERNTKSKLVLDEVQKNMKATERAQKEMNSSFSSVNKKLEAVSKDVKLVNQKTEAYKPHAVTFHAEVKRLKDELLDKTNQSAMLQKQIEALCQQQKEDQKKNAGRCAQQAVECENIRGMLNSPTCQRPQCAQLAQQIKELEHRIQQLEAEQDRKLNLMKHMSWQHDSHHDQLSMEYDALATSVNPNSILFKLEEQFEDPFDAKLALTGLFVDAYNESKKCVIEFLCQYFDELYTVQPEDSQGDDMESLSNAFGLLLQSSGVKTRLQLSTVTPHICEKIKQKYPTLEPYGRAKNKLEELDLPLEKVVEVTWKFVTEPNPVIVCQPEEFNHKLHQKYFEHWKNELCIYRLLHAHPVIYYSYRGHVMRKGLVGNEKK